MMEIPTELHTLFLGQIRQHDGRFVVDVPRGEIESGDVRHGETYRVAILSAVAEGKSPTNTGVDVEHHDESPALAVEEGEHRTVEIETIGDQGDGVTRVERGFVVIVSNASIGEEVTVEITNVRANVAFADIVDRPSDVE